MTVKWRGKPVFIKHRSAEDVAEINKANVSEMRHPQTDAERVKNPEWCARASAETDRLAHIGYRACLRLRRGPCNYNVRPLPLAQARCARRVHASGLRAHPERGRLPRVVLPVPRLALRRLW